MAQPRYLQPSRVDEALAALAQRPWSVLAGGTDFYPARVGRPLREDVLDICALSDLRGIAPTAAGWRIGALTTWTDLLRTPLPAAFDALKAAAREVGGLQIQNAGTLGGNVCNASPAADGIPPLLALDARVELSSAAGVRLLPLTEFVVGARHTRRQPGELLTAFLVPALGVRARSTFLKLGARRYLVISIAMVAITLDADNDGLLRGARIAVGACSPVAKRLPALEGALQGRHLSEPLAPLVDESQLAPLAPIDDIRGSAAYRVDAVQTLLGRALEALRNE